MAIGERGTSLLAWISSIIRQDGLSFGFWTYKPFPKQQILHSSKLTEFADYIFKFDENGGKLSKRVENEMYTEYAYTCIWCFTLFWTQFHFYCMPSAPIHAFPGDSFTSDSQNILAKPLAAFLSSYVGKGEIAPNEQFLLCQQWFQPFWTTFSHFRQIQNCHLQIFSVWKCLKFFVFERVNPFPNKPWFLRVCNASLLKTLRKKEKLLVTSNLSFSYSVFDLFRELSAILHQNWNSHLQALWLWEGLKFVVLERVNPLPHNSDF